MIDQVKTQELVPLIERLRSAFSLWGVDVEVQEAPPARRGGIVLVASKLGELGRVLVDDADTTVKKLLGRIHDDQPGSIPVLARGRDRALDAAIDPDLPAKAFLRLQGRLPAAPSGRIVYNRQLGQWQDSLEAASAGGG